MKTKIFFSAALFLTLITAAQAQTLPAYLPSDGLVGWWPFNGNANDESGNGNNGTVNGAALTADRFGVLNSAYGFDGLDDFINFNNNQSLIFNSADFTVAFWVKRSELIPIGSYDNGAGFMKWDHGFATPGANEFACAFSDLPGYENKFVFSVESSNSIFFTLSQTTIDDGNWFYVTGQRNGDSLKVYVNGIAEAATFIGDIIINNVGRDLLLATYSNNQINPGPINYTNAIFDDIAIYNRALSQEEITALYTGEPVNTPTTCNPLPANLQNGLVGYWPFCGNANDESGNGNDGTVNGATLTVDRFGMANAAYDFDGVDDWIQVQNDSTLNLSGDISISSWLNADSYDLVSMIVSKHSPFCDNNLGTFVYGIWDDGGVGNFKTNFSASPTFTAESYPNNNASVSENNWYNFIATYSNSLQVLKYYLNGALVDTINIDFDITTNPFDLYIGKQDCSNTWHFDGTLDDIGIWNRALSADEVQELYTLNACTFTVYDTVTVENYVTIYDTVSVSVSITDTLIINTLITAVQPAQENTFLVYPNPASTQITINNGNVGILGGYTMRISNSIGQDVYNQNITQTEVTLDLSNWGGNGLYVLYIVDPQQNIVAVKQIVLQ
jgi:hypothetical protein